MKFARAFFVPLLLAASLALAGCEKEALLSGKEIDPAGNLTRGDYLNLRHREAEMASQQQAEAPPPVPAMPAPSLQPPSPLPAKLVSVSVTDSVRMTPATERPDLKILSVAPGEVRLDWAAAPGDAPLEISLHPHQAYDTATGKIVEGGR